MDWKSTAQRSGLQIPTSKLNWVMTWSRENPAHRLRERPGYPKKETDISGMPFTFQQWSPVDITRH